MSKFFVPSVFVAVAVTIKFLSITEMIFLVCDCMLNVSEESKTKEDVSLQPFVLLLIASQVTGAVETTTRSDDNHLTSVHSGVPLGNSDSASL